MLVLAPAFWWLGLVDFLLHGFIDKVIAYTRYKKGWDFKDTMFWYSLGFDQELHNYTHIAYILFIVLQSGAVLS
jgi:hypothetical protein